MGRYLEKLKRFEKSETRAERHPAPAPTIPASIVEDVVIEPAHPNAKPVYWERRGSIVGPGIPEFLAKVGDGPSANFWVVVQFEGLPVWVNSIMLRSRAQFETQRPLAVVELVRDPR